MWNTRNEHWILAGNSQRSRRLMTRYVRQALKSVIVLALVSTTAAGTQEFTEVARVAYAAYAAAQVEWQRGLAELIIEGRPDFERAAMVQRDLQVAYIKRRTARFEYLLDQEPSRIVLTQGLSAFLNFGWSDEDTESLVEADPRYAALERSVAELREGNDDHPDWPSFREYFRSTLTTDTGYQALLNDLTKTQNGVSGTLEAYVP